MPNFIDISLPIFTGMPNYPGTESTSVEAIESTGPNILSLIKMTSHAGTHVDAPSHSLRDAPSVDKLPLELFYGSCRVVDLTNVAEKISQLDLKEFDIQEGERILLKTRNSLRGYDNFYDDYVYLTSEGAEYLASVKVQLVGIDTLSIKQKGSTDNTAHTALLSQGIPILAGLNLTPADAREYTLCAFPLAFQGIDGSPLRAVLMET